MNPLLPIISEQLTKSIVHENTYLLTYHKNRDSLYPIVMPAILEIECALKQLPPLKIAREDLMKAEDLFRSVTRRIAGYAHHIVLETIKEGFPGNDFFSIYLEHERREIAVYLFQEQETHFRQTINDTLLELCQAADPTFYHYFRNQLLHHFTTILISLLKDVFLLSMSNEPAQKITEPVTL